MRPQYFRTFLKILPITACTAFLFGMPFVAAGPQLLPDVGIVIFGWGIEAAVIAVATVAITATWAWFESQN